MTTPNEVALYAEVQDLRARVAELEHELRSFDGAPLRAAYDASAELPVLRARLRQLEVCIGRLREIADDNARAVDRFQQIHEVLDALAAAPSVSNTPGDPPLADRAPVVVGDVQQPGGVLGGSVAMSSDTGPGPAPLADPRPSEACAHAGAVWRRFATVERLICPICHRYVDERPCSNEASAALLRGRADALEGTTWPGKNIGATRYEADQLRKQADELERPRPPEPRYAYPATPQDPTKMIEALQEIAGMFPAGTRGNLSINELEARLQHASELAHHAVAVPLDYERPCTDKAVTEADATSRDHQLVSDLLERWRVDSAFCFMVRGQLARLLAQVRAEERAQRSAKAVTDDFEAGYRKGREEGFSAGEAWAVENAEPEQGSKATKDANCLLLAHGFHPIEYMTLRDAVAALYERHRTETAFSDFMNGETSAQKHIAEWLRRRGQAHLASGIELGLWRPAPEEKGEGK